jgi:hypothetical protein
MSDNHSANVLPAGDKPLTRVPGEFDDLEAISAIAVIMDRLGADKQRRVAAFVRAQWGPR